jgi:hypothetical protein
MNGLLGQLDRNKNLKAAEYNSRAPTRPLSQRNLADPITVKTITTNSGQPMHQQEKK